MTLYDKGFINHNQSISININNELAIQSFIYKLFMTYEIFVADKLFTIFYFQAVLNVLKEEAVDKSGIKLGGRELLDLIIRKWGVAYDIQLRKNKVR